MRRRKYTYELILSIINEHIGTGTGSKAPGAKYGINDARVAEWLKEYHVRGRESFLRDGMSGTHVCFLSAIGIFTCLIDRYLR